jgi:Domain of unknown function (DUF222)
MAQGIHHTPRHPVSAVVDALRSQVDDVSEVPLWSMGAAETGATLQALTRLSASIAELELRVALHAEAVETGEATGAASTASWWAHATRQTRSAAHRKLRLAAGLDRHPLVRDALSSGELLVDQASAIVNAVEAIPADLADAATIRLAEETLVRDADEHDAKALKILGRRILEVVAPEVGEAHEARLLEQEEREASRATRLVMSSDGHGCVRGRFTLPALQGAMLRKVLLALAAPRHRAATDGQIEVRTATPERMGRAFCEYVDRYPSDRLPEAGGVAATVVVTMSLDSLTGGVAAASLDTGERISAGEARRIACNAGIVPAVLGSDSQVLDLGRKRRFHTPSQRMALGLEQGGCTAEGCDWPPGLCHAHHEVPWSQGGETSVRRGRLLCPRHHARAHDPAFAVTKLPTGRVQFVRRT